jgi:hypothetical protein
MLLDGVRAETQAQTRPDVRAGHGAGSHAAACGTDRRAAGPAVTFGFEA